MRIFGVLVAVFGASLFFTGCPTHNLLRETPVKWNVDLKALEAQHFTDAQTHILPEGLTVYMKRPPGDVTALYQQGTRQADGAFQQGIYLAMLVLKYKVTGDESLVPKIKKAWDAAHFLVTGSGYPGLVARSFGKNQPTDPGYIFRKDGSGDGLMGWLFGTTIFTNLFEDPVRKAQAAEDVKAICLHLKKHDLKIYESEDKPTPYGNFKTPVMGVPIGHYAMPMMSLANLAVNLNPGDADCIAFLDWLVEMDYHRQSQYFYSWFPHQADNSALFALNMIGVWMNDQTPHRRKFYKMGGDAFWKRVYDWQNALYACAYKFMGGDDKESYIQDSFDRLRNLSDRYYQVQDEEKYTKAHMAIVPLEDRTMSSFLWSRNVYDELTKKDGPPDQSVSFYRMDFLIAYWFGRYLGQYQSTEEE